MNEKIEAERQANVNLSLDRFVNAKIPKRKRNTPLVVITFIGALVLFTLAIALLSKTNTPEITQIATVSSPNPSPKVASTPEPIENILEGKLAFVSDGQIWTINANASGKQQITEDEFSKFSLSISPDKKYIAYSFYPTDPEERTNSGAYVGYNSGVAVIDLETKETRTLIPYGNIQNHYATWSTNSEYISVWVGNGLAAKLVEVSTGKELFTTSALEVKDEESKFFLPSNSVKTVSPIVWLPKSNKVSYISNGNLISANVDNSNQEILAKGLDALRGVHEGPNVPQPPRWSESERYVTFYKNADLHLMDGVNKTDIILGEGVIGEFFQKPYPQSYLIGFGSDETNLYLLDYNDENLAVSLELQSNKRDQLDKVTDGQSLIISPDKTKVAWRDNNVLTIFSTVDNSTKSCQTSLRYEYYTWAGGFGYSTALSAWSPNSNALVGDINFTGNLNILNTETCDIHSLQTKGAGAVWFPN